MPRPRKCRRVCSMPNFTEFGPRPSHSKIAKAGKTVVLSIDEYEAIRLIDVEGLTQEECSEQMGIARTTAQAIYADARKKLGECIVNGYRLNIAGGDVQICGHRSQVCDHGCCLAKGSAVERQPEKGE